MRKPAFCIRENKDADQLCLCFRYSDSTIPYFLNPKFQAFSCTAWFVSYMVGNPEDRFSQNEAHTIISTVIVMMYDHANVLTPNCANCQHFVPCVVQIFRPLLCNLVIFRSSNIQVHVYKYAVSCYWMVQGVNICVVVIYVASK